jgi:sugar lactone lactonase YvrE
MRDKTRNMRFAATLLAIAVSCLSSALLFGEDGRNFAGSFEIRNAVNRGSAVEFELRLRVFNYSGTEVTEAALQIEDRGPGLRPDRQEYGGSFVGVSIPNRQAVDLLGTFTIPLNEYEQWSAGAIPKLVISFTGSSGEQIRNAVELKPEFSGELPKSKLPFASASSPGYDLALQDDTALSSSTVINTIAGGGPNNLPALASNVPYPVNTAVDRSGNYYILEPAQDRVFKVYTSGILTVLAGTGFPGYSGNGGPAPQARLSAPGALAVDSSGNAYIADTNNCVIRKVTASTGHISTFAGTTCGYGGDGGSATSAKLYYPAGIATDASGNVYIADPVNQRIRKVTVSTGKISTIAGNGRAGYFGDGGAATSAELNVPYGVALDGFGNLYIADFYNYRIRKVGGGTGKISTVAGNGRSGYSGDGGAATSAEIGPAYGISVDSSGRIFVADTFNCAIREVDTSNKMHTVAGSGPSSCGFSGDGSAATTAQLSDPYGVAVDTSDHMFIADYGNDRIRKASLGGTINTAAGNGTGYFAGNGVLGIRASLFNVTGAVPDASGNVYIVDQNNCVIRKVAASTGIISTFAGIAGSCGYSGDGRAATSALLNNPAKAVPDSAGNVYIADAANHVIRKVTASTGHISTVAGTPGSSGYSGDGHAATSARLFYPEGLTLGSSGLYVADTYNQRIRKVNNSGVITTVAGNGTQAYAGDGGSATKAALNQPTDVAVDASSNFYIADSSNQRVRVVNPSGIIHTFAGNGRAGFEGDGVAATHTSLYYPTQIAVDAAREVLISDSDNNRIRLVDTASIIHTVAGSGRYGFSGDGGVPTSADLANPWGVGVDPSGNIYIADSSNFRVRKVSNSR